MPVTPPGTGQPPDEPLLAVCAASYIADRVPAFAFVFRVPSTDSRFTVHTRTKDRYLVGETYPLILAEPDTVPLPLSLDDWDFLRHCLHNAARRWRDAIEQANAGAEQPQQDQPAEPGYLNIEPTPAGYQAAAQLFADELARVEQLNARLGHLLRPVQTARQDGDRS
jgi:hypothetical protein